jgi:hypothetical protein
MQLLAQSAMAHFPSAKAELQQCLATPPQNFNLPPGSSGNAWQIAHAALQALRDAGDERFLFLRTILEMFQTHVQQHQPQSQPFSNPDEELFFHSIGGCRHVILSKYTHLSPIFLARIRDFFMVLGHEISLSRTIRLACYNTSASVWKRQWNEEDTYDTTENSSHTSTQQQSSPTTLEEQSLLDMIASQQPYLKHSIPHLQTKHELFHYLQERLLVTLPTPGQSPSSQQEEGEETMEAGANYLSILVGEFARKSASHYRLALEFHKRAHASFENDGWLDRSP